MENEIYLFAVTAVNQVGESMINSSIMIRTNESRKSYIVILIIYVCNFILCTFLVQFLVHLLT